MYNCLANHKRPLKVGRDLASFKGNAGTIYSKQNLKAICIYEKAAQKHKYSLFTALIYLPFSAQIKFL